MPPGKPLLYPRGSKMQYSQPASLFKYKLSQAHFSFEARQVCLTPKPSLNHYFVCWDKLKKKKRWLGNQNWAKYKSNFDGKNQIKIVIATNYAIWNMQMYCFMQECVFHIAVLFPNAMFQFNHFTIFLRIQYGPKYT